MKYLNAYINGECTKRALEQALASERACYPYRETECTCITVERLSSRASSSWRVTGPAQRIMFLIGRLAEAGFECLDNVTIAGR